MPIRPILSCLLLIALSTSCSRDPNVLKVRYLQNGNKYFDRGQYKNASIMYRTALQKDAKFGDAYYRLAVTDLKLGSPIEAIGHLRRAVELLKPDRPERSEARVLRAKIYLAYLDPSPNQEEKLSTTLHPTTTIPITA